MRRRVLKNAISLWLIQLVNYVGPFVILLHLTAVLGLEIYGVLAFAQGIASVCLILVDFGFSLSATSEIARNRDNKQRVSEIIAGVLAVKFIVFLACCAVIISYAMTTGKYGEHRAVFIMTLGSVFAQSMTPVWLFHGLEKIKYAAIAAVSAKFVAAALIVWCVTETGDYLFVPLLTAAGDFVALLLSITFMKKLGYVPRYPTLRVARQCYDFSRNFFFSRAAVASYSNLPVIILGMVSTPSLVAVYSMADQLYKAMQSALSPIASASFPYMIAVKDPKLMFYLIAAVMGLAGVGAICGYFLSPLLMTAFLDPVWLTSLPVLNVFFLAIPVHAAAIMTGYPLAALVDRLDVANHSVIFGAMVCLLLIAIMLIGEFVSPVTLAVVMLVSEFFVFVYRSTTLLPLAIKRR
jgi:PST family polysaccharide transporter